MGANVSNLEAIEHLTDRSFGKEAEFTINGKTFKVGSEVTGDLPLVQFIRNEANLKGTKFMCEEGGCGACTVAATFSHPVTKKQLTRSVNSCLVPVLACHGWSITTVEGIGGNYKGYHKIQKRLAAANGSQCGYCSPGFVMSMYSLLEQSPNIRMKEVENALGGNICRCTGYRPILDAFKSLASDAPLKLVQDLSSIEDEYCSKRAECQGCCGSKCYGDIEDIDFIASSKPLALTLKNKSEWYKPANRKEIFELLDMIGNRKYRFVAGNTAQGVYRIKTDPEVYIDVNGLAETHEHDISADQVYLGANLSLTETMEILKRASDQYPEQFFYCATIADGIDQVANVSVRNIGTIAGNLMIKHERNEFPSDIFTMLEGVGALIVIHDRSGMEKKMSLIEFLTLNMSKRLITKLLLNPYDAKSYRFGSYKICPRSQNAHAYVHACFLMKVDSTMKYKVLEKPKIVYSGILPKFVHAGKTEEYLIGRELLNPNTLSKALNILSGEILPDQKLPDASPGYRKGLAEALFYKFVLSLSPEDVTPQFRSGGEVLQRPLSQASHDIDTDKDLWPINKMIPKTNNLLIAGGEAMYANDVPTMADELFAQLVLADQACATIKGIDASDALKIPGVVAFYNASDIPGENTYNIDNYFFPTKNEVFADGMTSYAGQPVGVIVAESHHIAKKAVKLVKIVYGKMEKPMTRVKEIVDNNIASRISLFNKMEAIQEKKNVKYTVEGEFELKSQYPMTMEPQTCVVIPKEDSLIVHPSTQWPHACQEAIAIALNIPQNRIQVEMKLVGGAYGSKITFPSQISVIAALSAFLTHRPVRLVLELKTMMKWVGKRFPSYTKYKVEVDENGEMQSFNANMYQDNGYSPNDSAISFSMHHFPNVYDVSTWNISFSEVTTDNASNTYIRGPGSTEAIATVDTIMEHIARVVKKDPLEVKKINMKKDDPDLTKILDDTIERSEFWKRKKEIEEFNLENRWKKRGIAIVPMLYPLVRFGNYYAGLSILRTDGTVQVLHGCVELGQGVNTKATQVAARELGIDINMITVLPTNTYSTPNNFTTGGCQGSDVVAICLKECSKVIKKRLEPIIKELGEKAEWRDIIKTAADRGIDLHHNHMVNLTNDLMYPIYGTAVSEVEIDVLTGQLMIKRVDLTVDAGQAMSPTVDLGQAEGAFVMGLGYHTSEQLLYTPEGKLKTNRTWNYKPPGAKDIPADFRVYFRRGRPSETAGMYRSKATGEPPLCTSYSIPLAIYNALESARKDSGNINETWFNLDLPYTPEHIWLSTLNNKSAYKL